MPGSKCWRRGLRYHRGSENHAGKCRPYGAEQGTADLVNDAHGFSGVLGRHYLDNHVRHPHEDEACSQAREECGGDRERQIVDGDGKAADPYYCENYPDEQRGLSAELAGDPAA